MEINQLKRELDNLILNAKVNKRDADFYLRVLVQVILTHGTSGALTVDVNLASMATDAANNCQIEFGDGVIKIKY